MQEWMIVEASGHRDPVYFLIAAKAREFQQRHGGALYTRQVTPWVECPPEGVAAPQEPAQPPTGPLNEVSPAARNFKTAHQR